MIACLNANYEVAQILLNNEADVNMKNTLGIVSCKHRKDCASLLLLKTR